MNRNYINIGILIVLVAAVFAASRTGRTELPAATTAVSPVATTSTLSPVANNVTLKAGTKTYTAHIEKSGSVLDLMLSLASTRGLTFTGKDYPSLGFFVESIDGKRNGDGMYWILYINETSSGLGASQATIHAGDTVEWRYENSY